MILDEEIRKLRAELAEKIPEDVLQLFDQKTKELVASKIAEGALREGDKMPAFSLPNAFGKTVFSDSLLKKGALVISFYRGSWCPYCNLELKALQSELPRIREAGADLIAISPELPDKSLALAEKLALEFEVLADRGNAVARKFGLVFSLDEELHPLYRQFGFHLPDFNGDESYELPLPATYAVGQDGTIHYAFVDADYTKRAEPADVLRSLAA